MSRFIDFIVLISLVLLVFVPVYFYFGPVPEALNMAKLVYSVASPVALFGIFVAYKISSIDSISLSVRRRRYRRLFSLGVILMALPIWLTPTPLTIGFGVILLYPLVPIGALV